MKRKTNHLRGNCYVASEALYHILGGKRAGWTPQVMKLKLGSETHWFLKHKSGLIIDPSRKQFKKLPNYAQARGCGFLTKHPSYRAQALISELTYQD